MIIDLQKFVQSERRHWAELESFLDKLENDPGFQLCQQAGFHFCGYNEQQNLNEDIALLFASRLR